MPKTRATARATANAAASRFQTRATRQAGATKNVENRGDLQQVSAELVMTRSRAAAAKRAMASNATKANSAENDRSQENGVVTEVVPVPAFEPEVANPQEENNAGEDSDTDTGDSNMQDDQAGKGEDNDQEVGDTPSTGVVTRRRVRFQAPSTSAGASNGQQASGSASSSSTKNSVAAPVLEAEENISGRHQVAAISARNIARGLFLSHEIIPQFVVNATGDCVVALVRTKTIGVPVHAVRANNPPALEPVNINNPGPAPQAFAGPVTRARTTRANYLANNK